ncbi:hypothetical protein JYU34_010270 [Plutella xylostella]|uniref:Uncharacterized protein n=1 Tax=Plutella xylostella TaxID=51655 RepID=A0ABQ7QIY9_PLUXY|nr:hypothetical protein JYU34_010270 [Plutella xylostella]
MPKGELQYFQNKAQHQIKLTDEWLKCLMKPVKMYLVTEEGDSWSVNKETMQLQYNQLTLETEDIIPKEEAQDIMNKMGKRHRVVTTSELNAVCPPTSKAYDNSKQSTSSKQATAKAPVAREKRVTKKAT